jgi:hypothetical protein
LRICSITWKIFPGNTNSAIHVILQLGSIIPLYL